MGICILVEAGGGGEEVLGYIEYDSSLLASCTFIIGKGGG